MVSGTGASQITKILVASWTDSTSTTNNTKNYVVRAFVSSGSTFELVGSIEGQYFDTIVNAAPTFSVSPSLEDVVIYGKSNSTTFFARMKVFNYILKTQTEISIPSWITATESAVSVSDFYLYARNIADKTGVTPTVR